MPQALPRRPTVFLDRDGTITEEGETPVVRPEQLRLLPGVARAIRRLNDAGLATVVVSNQAVVARGLLTLEGLAAIHRRMAELLEAEAGARLDAVYFCPHHPDPQEPTRVAEFCVFCECRKPAPGMFLRAAEELRLDLRRSFLIGDSTRDILAGQRAGCLTALLTGVGHRGRDAQCVTTPTRFAADLPEAVEWVLEWAGKKTTGT